MRIIERDVCKCFSKQKKIHFKSVAYAVSKQKDRPVVEAEGGGGKRDTTDSFCEHVGLFLKLLTLTNKVAVN